MISSQISYDGMSFFALETQPGTQTFGSGSGTDHYYFNKTIIRLFYDLLIGNLDPGQTLAVALIRHMSALNE